jgi:hypothetical protein
MQAGISIQDLKLGGTGANTVTPSPQAARFDGGFLRGVPFSTAVARGFISGGSISSWLLGTPNAPLYFVEVSHTLNIGGGGGVPEPAAVGLLATGVAGLAALAWRRRSA